MADQPVLQPDRHAGDAVGGYHGEGIADVARCEGMTAHQHQSAAGIGVAVAVAVEAGDAEPVAADIVDPAGFGQAAAAAIAIARLQPPAVTAITGNRTRYVDDAIVAIAIALQRCAGLAVAVQCDGNAEGSAAIALLVQILVDRQIGRPAARETPRPERASEA